jgi:hypothetical protein
LNELTEDKRKKPDTTRYEAHPGTVLKRLTESREIMTG